MLNYRLLYILFFISVFSFAQSPLVLASYEQANAGSGDAITILNPDIYYNNTSIDATAISEGDDVDIWSDLSGNTDHATNTLTASPELHLNGSDRQITFDGTDWLDIADASVCDYTLGTDEFTIVVREGDVVGTNGTLVSKAVLTVADRKFVLYKSGSALNYIVNHGGTAATFTFSPTVTNTNKLIILVFTTTQVNMWIDGQASVQNPVTLDTSAGSHASQSINIGSRTDGGFMYSGDLDLVAIIPSALDPTERENIETEFQIN